MIAHIHHTILMHDISLYGPSIPAVKREEERSLVIESDLKIHNDLIIKSDLLMESNLLMESIIESDLIIERPYSRERPYNSMPHFADEYER